MPYHSRSFCLSVEEAIFLPNKPDIDVSELISFSLFVLLMTSPKNLYTFTLAFSYFNMSLL